MTTCCVIHQDRQESQLRAVYRDIAQLFAEGFGIPTEKILAVAEQLYAEAAIEQTITAHLGAFND